MLHPKGSWSGTKATDGGSYCAPPWSDTIARGEKVLLYVGRLHPKKGLANLLHAWRELGVEFSDWHLVIAGWDQGLVGMKVGGRRRLVIPPSLAYGDTRHGPIPPNATLLFDITLVSVQ